MPNKAPHPYEIITWRGLPFDNITKAAIQAGEREAHATVTVVQGPWHPGVDASAGAHDKSGAADFAPVRPKVLRAFKNVGWCIWHRPTVPDVWNEHDHGVLRGDQRMSPVADAQVPLFDQRLDGLLDNTPDLTYRPKPEVTFKYDKWCREQNLRRKIAQTSRDIHHLVARRRKAKRLLKRLHSH